MTPPLWLQNLLARRSASAYGWVFRYCYRCDLIRWRRHLHRPVPAWVVQGLTRAVTAEAARRRGNGDQAG